jgi:hypothetical protein
MDTVSTYKTATLINSIKTFNSIKIINSFNVVPFIVNPDESELPAAISGSFTPSEITLGGL